MTTRHEHAIRITKGHIALEGILGLPADSQGVVVFAHGSGSGRLSPRNNFVAHHLQQDGLATLLLDLLTEEESEDRHKVFDIDLLADRLLLAKRWSEADPRTGHLKIGYFGASTGAGAALQAAAREPSNSGRPRAIQHQGRSLTWRTTRPGRVLSAIGPDPDPVDRRRPR